MEIHKFGGASIKDTQSILHVVDICKTQVLSGFIVVSAFGKTTNKLEQLLEHYVNKKDTNSLFQLFSDEVFSLINSFFSKEHSIYTEVEYLLNKLCEKLKTEPSDNYNYEYDQIVSFGEIITGPILSAILIKDGCDVDFIDASRIIKTNSNYKEGVIDWYETEKRINKFIKNSDKKIHITQGFIASDLNNISVTLGREGSDYSAAIIANIINAKNVTVWKDVPGIMCADPNWLPGCEKLDQVSFHEIIELSFFGAKVIHPKTIKPLQNKNIPLLVKSFKNPLAKGTYIDDKINIEYPPIFVKKENQILLSIWQKDYAFIVEKNLSHIFLIFDKYNIKVNLMQHSAISFSVCVDANNFMMHKAIDELKLDYHVKYNDNLELISIRHFNLIVEENIVANRTILLEQKSRSMARYVMKVY